MHKLYPPSGPTELATKRQIWQVLQEQRQGTGQEKEDGLISVAKFVCACLDKMSFVATGLCNDNQTSDQPDVAGRDVMM